MEPCERSGVMRAARAGQRRTSGPADRVVVRRRRRSSSVDLSEDLLEERDRLGEPVSRAVVDDDRVAAAAPVGLLVAAPTR